jgi:hypothetical protein
VDDVLDLLSQGADVECKSRVRTKPCFGLSCFFGFACGEQLQHHVHAHTRSHTDTQTHRHADTQAHTHTYIISCNIHAPVCVWSDAPQVGDTALLSAASNGHADCIRVLLEAGADANVRETFVRSTFFDSVRIRLWFASLSLDCRFDFKDCVYLCVCAYMCVRTETRR